MKKEMSFFTMMSFILMSVFLCASAVQAMQVCTADFSIYAEGGGTVQIEGVSAPDGMEIPMPKSTVIEIQDDPVDVSMEYEEPGEYLYRVKQTSGGPGSTYYDDSVYTVSVSVFVGDTGTLQTVVTSKKDSETDKPADILFVNTTPTPTPTPTPPVSGQNTSAVLGGPGNVTAGAAGKSAEVQTGDENMIFSAVAAGASLAAIIGVLIWKRKRSR